jgi:hypothetical protein
MILDPEDEAFNDIERQAKQRKEVVLAAINKEKPMKDEKAFPNPHLRDDSGMTLRDYFAAKALQVAYDKNWDMFMNHTFESPEEAVEGAAKDAYELADAMLKAREA